MKNDPKTVCTIESHQCDEQGKKVYVCHYTAEGTYMTLCVSLQAGGHLNHPEDECGPCDAPESFPSGKPTNPPSHFPSGTPSPGPSNVPSFQPTQQPSQSPSQAPTGHPTPPPTPEGIAERFIMNSVFVDLPPISGTETQNGLEITFDATFPPEGLISMAESYDLIDFVECGPDQMDIYFREAPDPAVSSTLGPFTNLSLTKFVTFAFFI